MIRWLDAIDHAITLACRGVVLLTGLGMLVSIGVGVVARYVIEVGGVDWAGELPKLLFAWFIMAGVVLGVQGGNHIAVDLIYRALGTPARRLLIAGTNLLIAAAYAILCVTSLGVAEIAAAERNPMLGTPGSIPFYALVIGSGLTAVCAVSIAVRVLLLGPDAAPQASPEESVQ